MIRADEPFEDDQISVGCQGAQALRPNAGRGNIFKRLSVILRHAATFLSLFF
jgi:hypothetical protein